MEQGYRPAGQEYKIPYMTILLIAVNVCVFAFVEWKGSSYDTEFMLKMGASYEPYVIEGHQYYRLVTHFFLHYGFEHLFNNMVSLLVLGYSLETALGRGKFILLYFLSGILAGAVSIVYNTVIGTASVSCGASGAVYGLMGGLAVFMIINGRGRGGSEIPRYLLYIGLSIYSGMRDTSIDNAAHIGGIVSGFLICLLFAAVRRRRETGRSQDF